MSVGNINAISDWINSKYSLSNKEKAMMTYFTKYYITFSGVPNESIIVKNSSIMLDYSPIILDDTGVASAEMYFLPGDTVTFVGTHISYEKIYTFGFDTEPLIRIMPEGAVYWYGNECIDVTGGWELVKLANNVNPNSAAVLERDFSTYSINVKQICDVPGGSYINSNIFKTKNKIQLSDYTTVKIHILNAGCTYKNNYSFITAVDFILGEYNAITGRGGNEILPNRTQNGVYSIGATDFTFTINQTVLDAVIADTMFLLTGVNQNTSNNSPYVKIDKVIFE